MTPNDYLKKVLAHHSLSENSKELKDLRTRRDEVEKLLRKKFEESDPTIRYGGSKAKGTMIVDAFDLDLTCYFAHDDTKPGETLAEIYNSTRDALAADYYVEQKASVLRLKEKQDSVSGADFHIDVVPGRFTDDEKSDAYLHRTTGDKKRLKTNLQVHIDHVRDSEVVDAIKLLKLWRFRNGLTIKHFILELLTVSLLKKKKSATLTEQLEHVWTKFRDDSDSLSVEDPANPSGNDLSELFDATVRGELSQVARSTLSYVDNDDWESVFGPVDSDSEEQKAEGLRKAVAAVSMPTRPWCTRL